MFVSEKKDMESEREKQVYSAKLSEQTERYDGTCFLYQIPLFDLLFRRKENKTICQKASDLSDECVGSI